MEKEKIIKEEFIRNLKRKLANEKEKKSFNEIVFLCVGTNNLIGDLVGPLVGSKLQELLKDNNYLNINIYGNLKQNVNYINIQSIMKKINYYHKEACLIVIDSALSNIENIGKIFISNKKTILGKSFNKDKVEIGDISIKAVVGKDFKIPIYNFKNLRNISLDFVLSISNILAEGIFDVIKCA